MTTVPREVDIAIIGGGIGGLALAAGLHRRGIRAHVFEGSSVLRKESSTMVTIGLHGLHALRELHPGLDDEIRRRGVANSHLVSTTRLPGCELQSFTIPGERTRLYCVRWAEVHDALTHAVPPEFVHCDHAATGYDEIWDEQIEKSDGTFAASAGAGGRRPADRAVVHFRNQPSVTARLVVGADGAFSPIRAAMYPDDQGVRYLGHMIWNCLLHNPGGNTVADAHQPGEIIVTADSPLPSTNPYIHVIVSDAGGGYTFWQVRLRCDEPSFTSQSHVTSCSGAANSEGSKGGHGDGKEGSSSAPYGCGRRGRGGLGVPGSKARVVDALKAAGWESVLPLLEATPESAIFERALYDRLPLERWASAGSRVVLLGDAAHAMHNAHGQGAQMALEDAHQLALALEDQWPDVPAALERYQGARIVRATRVQCYSAEQAGLEFIRESVRPVGLSAAEMRERMLESRPWLHQYPHNVEGDPNSKWWKPMAKASVDPHTDDTVTEVSHGALDVVSSQDSQDGGSESGDGRASPVVVHILPGGPAGGVDGGVRLEVIAASA